jgi:hypothetical protein
MTISRNSCVFAWATAALIVVAGLNPCSAQAQGKERVKRFSLYVAPKYTFSTNTDANAAAPVPPGRTPVGYTHDNPTIDTVRIDYGVSFAITPDWKVFYNHGNAAYQLGRILTISPTVSFVSGAIYDYTDTYGFSYATPIGVGVSISYFSHQRSDVTGLCLNQKSCNDPVTGKQFANPLSINSHGYDAGLSYDFGPNTRIGKLLTATFDADYYIRPSTPPPGAALGGLGSWVGNTWEFPWSITTKIPVLPDKTFIPTFTYISLPVLYQDSAVPEAYRGIVWGFAKNFGENFTLSYTNFNLQSCRCIARVPPPDNLRLAWGELKLNLHDSF